MPRGSEKSLNIAEKTEFLFESVKSLGIRFPPKLRMGPFDLFHFAYEALVDRKLRSAMTILMVIVGASLVTSLNGMSQGMNNFIDQQLSTIALNVLIVIPAPRPLAAFGGGPSSPPTMTFTEQTAANFHRLVGVQQVIPFFRGTVTVQSAGLSRQTTVIGVEQTKLLYVNPTLSLAEGNWLGKFDGIGIVFGSKVAFPPGQTAPFVKLGQMVTLEYSYVDNSGPVAKAVTQKRSFQVKGILNELGTEFRDEAVYLAVPTANTFLNKGGKYDGFFLVSSGVEDNDRIEKAILTFYGPTNIGVITPKAFAERMQGIISGFAMFMTTIGLVSMLIGSVGIITTQFTSVMERTREIGVLKALGFDNKLVLIAFLCESATIGMLGGAIGIAVGSLASDLVVANLPIQGVRFLRANKAVLTPIDLVTTWMTSVALSVLAGLYPAWRASRMFPVEALRKE